MSEPSFYVDDSVVTIRAAEVPAASFANGVNAGGSNAPGIGIGEGVADLVGTPEQFTLLDQGPPVESGEPQIPAARAPQDSQFPGGAPLLGGAIGLLPGDPLRFGTVGTTGDGIVTPTGSCTLSDLAVGWVGV